MVNCAFLQNILWKIKISKYISEDEVLNLILLIVFMKTAMVQNLDDLPTEEEREEALTYNPKTKFIEVFPKTIVNKVDSPDLAGMYSMNPYQGM